MPDLETRWQRVSEALPAPPPTRMPRSVSHRCVYDALKKCNNGAEGVDGWSGQEVAEMSSWMRGTLYPFLVRCNEVGQVPSRWKVIRQVHLTKGSRKKKKKGEATKAEDLRPISIYSVFWRVLASWMEAWLPESTYGGRRGVGAKEAIMPLLLAAAEGQIVMSLDLSKAFDHVNPELALRGLETMGMGDSGRRSNATSSFTATRSQRAWW